MVGWMDHGLRGYIFFPFHASITIEMGVIFRITNRVNKQIIPHSYTKILTIKVKNKHAIMEFSRSTNIKVTHL